MGHQFDSHVKLARTSRTVFHYEAEPGKAITIQSAYLVPQEKMTWAVLRMVEGKRLEMEGRWREDLDRMLADIEKRRAD